MPATYCDHCNEEALPSKPLKSCAGCRTVHYCSKQCQVDAWKAGHKAQCKACAERREEVIDGVGKRKLKAYRNVEGYLTEYRPQLAYLAHRLLGADLQTHVAVLRVVRQEEQPAGEKQRPAYKITRARRMPMDELEAGGSTGVSPSQRIKQFAQTGIPVAYATFIEDDGPGDRRLCMDACLPLAACVEGCQALAAHLASPKALSIEQIIVLLNEGRGQQLLQVISSAAAAALPTVEDIVRDPTCISGLLESLAKQGSLRGPLPSMDPSKPGSDQATYDAFMQTNFYAPPDRRRQLAQQFSGLGLGDAGIAQYEEQLRAAREARE